MHISVILSPRHSTGTTTIANYLLNELGSSVRKETALLIEFSKSTGKSVFINNKSTERNRCLSDVVINTSVLKDNICKSFYNSNCMYLAQNVGNSRTDLNKYPIHCIQLIIDEVKKSLPVDHIIIDLPADLEEQARLFVMSDKFKYKVDNWFLVLDEDVLTFKSLKDMSEIHNRLTEPIKHTTVIVNKTTNGYVDYIDRYNPLGFPVINLIKIPYIHNMNDLSNRAKIYSVGSNKVYAELESGIKKMVSIIRNRDIGHGVKLSKDLQDELLEAGHVLVGGNNTSTKSKPSKKSSKPKKEKKSKQPKSKKKTKQVDEPVDNEELEVIDFDIQPIGESEDNTPTTPTEENEITQTSSEESSTSEPVEEQNTEASGSTEEVKEQSKKSKTKAKRVKSKKSIFGKSKKKGSDE